MSLGSALIDRLFVRGTVAAADPVTPRMRRIVVSAPGLTWTPGQHVRVAVDGVMTRRTYSIWDYDGAALELRVLDHGDGPGARWARAVRPDPNRAPPTSPGRHGPSRRCGPISCANAGGRAAR